MYDLIELCLLLSIDKSFTNYALCITPKVVFWLVYRQAGSLKSKTLTTRRNTLVLF